MARLEQVSLMKWHQYHYFFISLFFFVPLRYFFVGIRWSKFHFCRNKKLNKNGHGFYSHYLYFIKMDYSCQRRSYLMSQHCCLSANWWLLNILINKMFLFKSENQAVYFCCIPVNKKDLATDLFCFIIFLYGLILVLCLSFSGASLAL